MRGRAWSYTVADWGQQGSRVAGLPRESMTRRGWAAGMGGGAWSYTVAGCGAAGQQGDAEWMMCKAANTLF